MDISTFHTSVLTLKSDFILMDQNSYQLNSQPLLSPAMQISTLEKKLIIWKEEFRYQGLLNIIRFNSICISQYLQFSERNLDFYPKPLTQLLQTAYARQQL